MMKTFVITSTTGYKYEYAGGMLVVNAESEEKAIELFKKENPDEKIETIYDCSQLPNNEVVVFMTAVLP